MPEKSQMLIEELNQVGLSIPRGRRRLSQVTLLSALTEAESLQLANDFKKVCVSRRVKPLRFPTRVVGTGSEKGYPRISIWTYQIRISQGFPTVRQH